MWAVYHLKVSAPPHCFSQPYKIEEITRSADFDSECATLIDLQEVAIESVLTSIESLSILLLPRHVRTLASVTRVR